jgi:hypothetical protein
MRCPALCVRLLDPLTGTCAGRPAFRIARTTAVPPCRHGKTVDPRIYDSAELTREAGP